MIHHNCSIKHRNRSLNHQNLSLSNQNRYIYQQDCFNDHLHLSKTLLHITIYHVQFIFMTYLRTTYIHHITLSIKSMLIIKKFTINDLNPRKRLKKPHSAYQ